MTKVATLADVLTRTYRRVRLEPCPWPKTEILEAIARSLPKNLDIPAGIIERAYFDTLPSGLRYIDTMYKHGATRDEVVAEIVRDVTETVREIDYKSAKRIVPPVVKLADTSEEAQATGAGDLEGCRTVPGSSPGGGTKK